MKNYLLSLVVLIGTILVVFLTTVPVYSKVVIVLAAIFTIYSLLTKANEQKDKTE